MLTITGIATLSLRNFQPDTAVIPSKMRSAELVIDDVVTPCIVHRVVFGDVEKLSDWRGNIALMIFSRYRHTAHTKKGFVDVQIAIKPTVFTVFIHTDNLERLLSKFAMSVVHNVLNSRGR